jgi:hypothetical protein
LPPPAFEPLQRTFDLLVPDRSALVVYVIEDDRSRVHASLIAVKERGDIVRAATRRHAPRERGPRSRGGDRAHLGRGAAAKGSGSGSDSGYRRVLAAVEEWFARPSIALFCERATLMRVITGRAISSPASSTPSEWRIDPALTWLLGLLGGAGMAAMAGRAASTLAQMLPQSARNRVAAFASIARGAMKESGAVPARPTTVSALLQSQRRRRQLKQILSLVSRRRCLAEKEQPQ